MSLSDDLIEQLQSDLNESENNYRVLDREYDKVCDEAEHLTNELHYWVGFQQWLSKVYPNAEKEYNAILDIEKGV